MVSFIWNSTVSLYIYIYARKNSLCYGRYTQLSVLYIYSYVYISTVTSIWYINFTEGVTVHPGVLVSSAEVGDDNKVSVKFNNGDEVSFTVG